MLRKRFVLGVLGFLVLPLFSACLMIAPEAADEVAAAPDHDFRATSHRRFDDLDHWLKVFDDPARDEWQRPAELVSVLDLKPGSCVADIGSGTGYLISYLAAAVGPEGCVIAVEVEPVLVDYLKQRARGEGLSAVSVVAAPADSPGLAASSIDMAVILDTYHHLDDRLSYLKVLRHALRPAARVAIVDWRKEPLPVGPQPDHKLAAQQVVEEMQTAGFRLIAEPDLLPYQYVLIFE